MQLTLFDMNRKTIEDITHPHTYKGIYSFHKYWGKKPTESIAYFIQNYTSESDIVLDPFLGSGFISRECLSRDRRFIGIDLNPFAIEHTNFLLKLPKASIFKSAFQEIEKKVKAKINDSYLVENSQIASHYLWKGNNLLKVWLKPEIGKKRIELEPTSFDLEKLNKFSSYSVRNIRKPTFFTNSRINSNNQMSLYDLFTPRALSNIDFLLDEIKLFPENIKRALLLTLTAASGQMSSMVFAITNRGKNNDQIYNKVEVGSWVIGYWRPELHFEINVWNCFESRVKKLHKALLEIDEIEYQKQESIDLLLNNKKGASIIHDDCIDVMQKIPDKSIKLICTDPPHSDRIPYLELSEMWNSLLNKSVFFEKEIIVSNAKERGKKIDEYIEKMKTFINESSRIMTDDGMLLIYFNARNKESWRFLEIVKISNDLQFIGTFPMEYSANSVVQDNRKNGMKTDYVLVIKKTGYTLNVKNELEQIPGWSVSMPEMGLVE